VIASNCLKTGPSDRPGRGRPTARGAEAAELDGSLAKVGRLFAFSGDGYHRPGSGARQAARRPMSCQGVATVSGEGWGQQPSGSSLASGRRRLSQLGADDAGSQIREQHTRLLGRQPSRLSIVEHEQTYG
jgi:hypothetical protein